MTGKILTLDLSTSATGWAIFQVDDKSLIDYGVIKPSMKGLRSLEYPRQQLKKMQDIAAQVLAKVESVTRLTRIGIEEVNKSRIAGRLSQKVLDALHFVVLDRIEPKIDLVVYKDSDGATGWRTDLGLVLTPNDRELNKQRKAYNKKRAKGMPIKPVITKKHLACRYVNAAYSMSLDCDERPTDGDVADAIGLGHALLRADG